MINTTIKPLNQITGYDSRWGWDKQEKEAANESRFARRLRRASDGQDEEQPLPGYSFENPSFNILSGKTNYAVAEIASDLKN